MQDTIAAIATAPGAGAIGVIRVSGPDAFALVRTLWRGLPDPPTSHHARLATLVGPDGAVLDHALVLPFVGPRSFTGDDVVELHCHGGRVTLEGVLRALLDAGARAAEPGAFTRRALETGKLDLVQAEAIADVIHAESRAAHEHAQSHLAGRLSAEIDAAKAALAETLTLVEAAIDFSLEEHVYSIDGDEIADRLAPAIARVEALLATYGSGRLVREGVRVALAGRPNAGKSTLLNHWLGLERAIVTDVPGTTRDYLEESMVLDDVLYRLTDTAGLRATDDAVEAEGIARSRARIGDADIVIALIDASRPDVSVELAHLLGELDACSTSECAVGVAFTQADRCDAEARARVASCRASLGVRSVLVSVVSGEGTSELAPWLRALAEDAGLHVGGEHVLLTRARHRSALEEARSSLERAREAAEGSLGQELVAADARAALDALGSLTGAVTSDEILGRIFAGFCVGK